MAGFQSPEYQLGAVRGGVDIEGAIAKLVGYLDGDEHPQSILLENLIGSVRILLETDFEAVPGIVGIV
jgi:hypothetical protein